MNAEQKAKKYEREKAYKSRRKSLCMVVTRPAYAYVARIAESLGWSVTRTIMYGAVCFWKSKSTHEINEIRKAPKADANHPEYYVSVYDEKGELVKDVPELERMVYANE